MILLDKPNEVRRHPKADSYLAQRISNDFQPTASLGRFLVETVL